MPLLMVLLKQLTIFEENIISAASILIFSKTGFSGFFFFALFLFAWFLIFVGCFLIFSPLGYIRPLYSKVLCTACKAFCFPNMTST